MVTVSEKAASIGQSTMALVKGERVTVRQLLYGLMLNSGNDAAIALAEHVAGTESRFVRMMNDLAATLHMRNTHYATPHGLDAPHHYSSARDLATIAMYAMRDPTFRRIVRTESYHIAKTKHNREHWLASVNRVIYWYPGVDGIKPGDTDAAGLCQVVSAWRNGHHLLAVLLNTPNLVTDIRNLLNYGARDFRWVQSLDWGDSPANVVSGGKGVGAWIYYVGAGHSVRGPFLKYFRSHGGLQTLGYPRTEEIQERGQRVQYFQGGELIYDGSHRTVYPAPLGRWLRPYLLPRTPRALSTTAVAPRFSALFRHLGGRGVFGTPETVAGASAGRRIQLFEYGGLGAVHGAPYVIPLGDVALRLRGWLPARGASDAFPPTLAGLLETGVHAPFLAPRSVHRPARAKAAQHARRA
jgi:hypothetical protein